MCRNCIVMIYVVRDRIYISLFYIFHTVYFLLHGVLPVDLQYNIQWLYKYIRV